MRFKFRAINLTGEIIEDTCFANSKEEAVKIIKSKELLCLAIEEDFQIRIYNIWITRKVGLKDLVIFCKLFYTLLEAGINISKSLEIISKNTTNAKLKSSIIDINQGIHKGQNLSDALENQNNIFPTLFTEMVRAGEFSGNLSEIIHRLGVYYDNQIKIENKIKASLIYPVLLIFVSIAVVVFILTFVLPIFFNMFSSRDLVLPLPTRILINISEMILQHWPKLIVLTILGIITIKIFMKTYKGRIVSDYLKLNVPFLKNIYIKIITANLTKTLSILLSSGVPLIQSLEMTGNVLNNIIIKNKLRNEIEQVEAGKLISDSIQDLEIFSSVVSSMIQVGEETGALDDLLLKTSLFYEEEVSASLDKLTKLIEPILMIIVGLIVGFIVISLALPMFELIYPI